MFMHSLESAAVCLVHKHRCVSVRPRGGTARKSPSVGPFLARLIGGEPVPDGRLVVVDVHGLETAV